MPRGCANTASHMVKLFGSAAAFTQNVIVMLLNRNTKASSSDSYLAEIGELGSWVQLCMAARKSGFSTSACFLLMVRESTPRSRCKGAEIFTCYKNYLYLRDLPSPHITALNSVKPSSKSWGIIGKVMSKTCVLPGRIIDWEQLQLNTWKK